MTESKKLDGVWTIREIEQRIDGRTADPNFKTWLRSLARMERLYAIGYLLDTWKHTNTRNEKP